MEAKEYKNNEIGLQRLCGKREQLCFYELINFSLFRVLRKTFASFAYGFSFTSPKHPVSVHAPKQCIQGRTNSGP